MRFVLLVISIFAFFGIFAQNTDSTTIDTTKLHSVRKATIYSAVLPGLGQIYNHNAMPKGQKKAFWKVPLIYTGLGASGYFLVSNQLEKNALKKEYINRTENGLYSDEWIQYDDQGVLTLYNQHLTWRDLSILAFSGVYLLQMIDAGVEAHFVNFDISEDLSMRISPVLVDWRTAGLSVKLNFR